MKESFDAPTAPHRKFVEALQYKGTNSFFDGETFIYNAKTGVLIPLTPFVFWTQCRGDRRNQGDQCCFIFDSGDKQKGIVSYKISGVASQYEVELGSEEDELLASVMKLREKDASLSILGNLSMRELSFDT